MKLLKRFEFELGARNIEAGDLFESFLVSAVSSILVIRAYLKITSFPEIIFKDFHIAHMLLGGFLMMLSVLSVLLFLNRGAKKFSAIVGGIGFGTFIDELGKFITRDNNYYFQPTISMIYVVFIFIYLAFRFVEKHGTLTPREYAVNALEVIKETFISDFNDENKHLALSYLKKADNNDPLIINVSSLIKNLNIVDFSKKPLFSNIRNYIYKIYKKIILTKRFNNQVVIFFIGMSFINFFAAVFGIERGLSFWDWGQIISTIISGIIVFIGVYYIIKSKHLLAYEIFKISILITIFLTQFFAFYREQLSAIVGLLVNLVILFSLQYFIEFHRARE